MAFTPEEITRIANAALDFYYTPDGLTPRERSRKRLKEARRALREAEQELAAAIEYRDEVRRMPFAERNKRWERTEKDPPSFKQAIQARPLTDLFKEEPG